MQTKWKIWLIGWKKSKLSVYAKGLLEKARREIETNYKETGFRETNFERYKREEKENGR